MQLNYDKLLVHLQRQLAPFYIVHGDEPLLVQEACLAIRQKAKQHQFSEQLSYYVDAQFNWGLLADQLTNFSLFSDKQLIELQLSAPVSASGSQLLSTSAQQPNPDKLLLISSGRLTQAQLQSTWCQMLSKQGVLVTIWPIQKKQLPAWVKQRLKNLGLNIQAAGLELLLEYCNGNLLTIQQLLEKLQLLNTEPLISATLIEQLINDSAHYTVFDLVEACLQGHAKLALRILYRLRIDNTELALIVWSLTRELRKLAVQAEQSSPLKAASISPPNSSPVSASQPLTETSTSLWYSLLVQCAKLDEMIKGGTTTNSWDFLQSLCLQFATRQLKLFTYIPYTH